MKMTSVSSFLIVLRLLHRLDTSHTILLGMHLYRICDICFFLFHLIVFSFLQFLHSSPFPSFEFLSEFPVSDPSPKNNVQVTFIATFTISPERCRITAIFICDDSIAETTNKFLVFRHLIFNLTVFTSLIEFTMLTTEIVIRHLITSVFV